jgi:hypothetical protein
MRSAGDVVCVRQQVRAMRRMGDDQSGRRGAQATTSPGDAACGRCSGAATRHGARATRITLGSTQATLHMRYRLCRDGQPRIDKQATKRRVLHKAWHLLTGRKRRLYLDVPPKGLHLIKHNLAITLNVTVTSAVADSPTISPTRTSDHAQSIARQLRQLDRIIMGRCHRCCRRGL